MKSKLVGKSFEIITLLSALFIVAVIAFFIIEIIYKSWGTLSWEFIISNPEEGMTAGGIFPAIVGTALLVILMSIIGVPIGTITAIYLVEYANSKSIFTKTIRFAVNTLAGVPSIVFGLFGLGFFIKFVGGGLDSLLYNDQQLVWGQPNLLWASFTMAFLTIPVVIVSVEEALRSVPDDLRAASLALGVSKLRTIIRIVIPNALTGIITGTILAIARGAGEVAPILFTGAAYFLPKLPSSLSDQFMNLGYHIYIMATQSTNVDETAGIQYATVAVLLLLTTSLTSIGVYTRYRIRKRKIQ
ncbi:MAG TPA: phosphate ABC transporter permease PstA [Ignavibacteriales bacterium]|nr:phosphate ABC transporter permease PstA [Ignavibacteriales bacterium]HOM65524.1 phosphate ABC transporter permease PstA [Ignavibacteriales bacterium]HRT98354.1 phosphate ABC transporter permease PstA [Ignavibacteriales bacterium]